MDRDLSDGLPFEQPGPDIQNINISNTSESVSCDVQTPKISQRGKQGQGSMWLFDVLRVLLDLLVFI